MKKSWKIIIQDLKNNVEVDSSKCLEFSLNFWAGNLYSAKYRLPMKNTVQVYNKSKEQQFEVKEIVLCEG